MNNQNELQHHGVLGMKWGVRRYQYKDGSLTPAGKKREAKLDRQMSKYAKKYYNIKRKKLEGQDADGNRKKTISDYTNEELKSMTTRLNIEKDYLLAIKNRKDAEPPKRVSKGKVFMEKLMKDYVVPTAADTGKKWLEKKIGLNKESESARLKREAQDYTNRVKIEKSKKQLATGKY